MDKYRYINDFEKLGFGLFVHFGLYSVMAKGEWGGHPDFISQEKYRRLAYKFKPAKNWADDLVKNAKNAGAKYITLTTRHHDGFSLFDTQGLSEYDAPHYLNGRDLVAEFTAACEKYGVVPFFYHTLLDWYKPEFNKDFAAYINYLIDSVEILCKNYGKIGGLWFDGKWSKPDEDWQEDRLYGVIRKYQPQAMIINNTGLNAQGQTGHKEIDSVTFERGKPCFVDRSNKPIAGEMCQTLNDHWGYCKDDYNFKSIKEILCNLIDCRKYDCNLLLNSGLKGNGRLNTIDKGILEQVGKWIKKNKSFIYEAHSCDVKADGADILTDGHYYYAVIKNVPMQSDPNVQRMSKDMKVQIFADVKNAFWLDNGKKIRIKKDGSFDVAFFRYGYSEVIRVAAFTI